MIAALAPVLAKPKLLGLGVAALAIAIVFVWLKWTIAGLERDVARLETDNATLTANLAASVAINQGNLVELDRFKSDSTALRAAFAGELQRLEARCRTETRIKTEIRRVQIESPATCPVAPAVGAALRGLQPDAEGGADRDEDRARDDRPAR